MVIPITDDRPGWCLQRRLFGGPGQRDLQHQPDLVASFTFTAVADTVDDATEIGESVQLAFGELPTGGGRGLPGHGCGLDQRLCR